MRNVMAAAVAAAAIVASLVPLKPACGQSGPNACRFRTEAHTGVSPYGVPVQPRPAGAEIS